MCLGWMHLCGRICAVVGSSVAKIKLLKVLHLNAPGIQTFSHTHCQTNSNMKYEMIYQISGCAQATVFGVGNTLNKPPTSTCNLQFTTLPLLSAAAVAVAATADFAFVRSVVLACSCYSRAFTHCCWFTVCGCFV